MSATTDHLGLHAASNRSKLALIDDRPGHELRTRTFGELDAEVNRLAHAIGRAGVEPGDRIGWLGKNSIEVMTWIHAARKAGTIAVPLGYRLTPAELSYVIDDADARLVFADAEHRDILVDIGAAVAGRREVVVFNGDPAAGQIAAEDFIGDAPDDEPTLSAGGGGSMVYTSGTTGQPKGALRRGSADPAQTAALIGLWGCQGDDVHVTCGPLYHSGPLLAASLAHLLGNTLVVQRNFDPEDWLRLIDAHGVTATFSAPTPIRMVTKLDPEIKARYDTSTMRMMLANAAPWPFALKLAYLDDFPAESLYEIYGATELGVCCTLLPEDQLRKPGSCGLPNPGVELSLIADDGSVITEPGVPGELFVRAASVLDTYHNAPDKFDEEHRDGGWHTVGDIAYVDDEGYVYICDRKKDMIISGGMNIYPAEVEAALEADDRVYEAAVLGLPSEDWGESVHAVVVPATALTEDDVRDIARRTLAGFKVPRTVSFCDQIPKTGTNKILKRQLRAELVGSDEVAG